MSYTLLAAGALLSGVACAATNSSPIVLGDATTLSTPTSVGTAPMFAVAPNGKQAIAWVSAPNGGTDGRLYISVANGAPAEIRDSLGPIEAHGEAPPKMAYAADGALYAVYIVGKEVPGERFPLSALRLVSSKDDGRTWTAPITVTDGEPFGAHNFHALHVAANGTIYVAWLGKPENDTGAAMSMPMQSMPGMAGMSHAEHATSTSWITRSTDGGKSWSPRVRVDTGEACPCCRTALATASDGTLYMAWRHIYPGSVRDVVVARSTDQGATWSPAMRVHTDDWKFDACPHAGPSIAVDTKGTLHVAWWTGKEGAAGVFYTQSSDGGKTFAAPTTLGAAQFSRPSHVQLALASKNRVIVTWDDGTKQIPQVIARVSADGGAHFGDAMPISSAGRAASFPVLGVMGDSLAVAWSEQSAPNRTDSAAKSADQKAPKGLEAVGSAQVMVRRGALK
jgi:hypothetical protein